MVEKNVILTLGSFDPIFRDLKNDINMKNNLIATNYAEFHAKLKKMLEKNVILTLGSFDPIFQDSEIATNMKN